LDEATSFLDNENELAVQASLAKLMSGRTTIVIAHRLSTIQNADWIIFLDKGTVVAEGTHDMLIKPDTPYSKMYNLEFRQHELSLIK
jgi:ABC-type multidrug transport system fused ATPase/permease subunit